VVQDVLSQNECIIRTDSGDLLDHVREKHLETVVPSVGKLVMVLNCSDSSQVGHLGKILERHSSKQTVIVQMEQTYELLTLLFDQISEYIDYH
jgi:G patch domain/KOW motif-containing protein